MQKLKIFVKIPAVCRKTIEKKSFESSREQIMQGLFILLIKINRQMLVVNQNRRIIKRIFPIKLLMK